jgi:hypothetical protein
MCLHRFDSKSRSVMRLGMLLLAVALVAQRFIHPAAGFPEDAADAIRGVLLGLSIGLNLWVVRRMSAGRPG